MTARRVSYTCLRGYDPRVKVFLEEIRNGRTVPALEHLQEAFGLETRMPLNCAPKQDGNGAAIGADTGSDDLNNTLKSMI